MKKYNLNVLLLILLFMAYSLSSESMFAFDMQENSSVPPESSEISEEKAEAEPETEKKSETGTKTEAEKKSEAGSESGKKTDAETRQKIDPALNTNEKTPEKHMDRDSSIISQAKQGSVQRRVIQPSEPALLTVQFFLSEDEEQPHNEQIVKNGDTLFDPGVPEKQDTFLGWFEKNAIKPFDQFGRVSEVGQSTTLKLYARFLKKVHVFYHDQNGEVIRTDSFQPNQQIKIERFSPSVQVDPNTQNHIGWATDANSNQDVSGDMQLTDQDVNLYPITQEGYWITFDTQGGTTLDRQFIALTDENKKILNKETYKQGYTFDRWTTDSTGETAWDFNQEVQQPMTLYAQWKPAESYYTIKYWLEALNP